jgi:excinuclease ABC subunit C
MSPKISSDFLNTLPQKPGVYRFFDSANNLLYVGKAINLKKRVNSYFTKKHDSRRLENLVSQIADIKFTIVKNEKDALLLENNLIKSGQPKYNILLKDDKTYPYIAIKKEHFPRVYYTRKKIADGTDYYGPYTSKIYTNKALETILRIFPVRSCSLNLSPKNIQEKKYKVCLEYHIGNCLGPCEMKQSESEYNETIKQIRNILTGKSNIVKQYLENKIEKYSENLEFEKAFDYSKRLEALMQYSKKNTIANTGTKDIRVFHIMRADNKFFIQYIKVSNGAITSAKNHEINTKLDEDERDVMKFIIEKYLIEDENDKSEIICPFEIDIENVKVTTPQQGERKKLLDLAFRNLIAQKQHYLELKQKKCESSESQQRILTQLKDDLKLTNTPLHIECFDNSNIQGTNPVASLVVFKNGKPAKKEYRHFKIKTVTGPDDFASMEEIVYRRYYRIKNDNHTLPDLIVIDGGKGQLNAAIKSLKKLNLYQSVPIIGIAKKLEEIYFPEDSIPLYINKKSESLKLIQRIRNEAHRFAITFHRDLRSKDMTKISLEEISGIGQKTITKLINEFGSVEKIKQASLEELALFIGNKKAELVLKSYNS